MSKRTHSRPLAVGRDPILPRWIGQDRIDDPRSLPRPLIEKIYLLVSADDAALRFSRRIAGGVPRVGAADTTELEGLGLTVIDLSKVEDSSSGSHSKFAGSPEVVRLIGSGLNQNQGFGETQTPALGKLLGNLPITILGP